MRKEDNQVQRLNRILAQTPTLALATRQAEQMRRMWNTKK
jgi:hypothetical protein